MDSDKIQKILLIIAFVSGIMSLCLTLLRFFI